jgi:inorganic triphosphatase YgiF
LALLQENQETCCELLYGCPWREALESGTDRAKLEAIQDSEARSWRSAKSPTLAKFFQRGSGRGGTKPFSRLTRRLTKTQPLGRHSGRTWAPVVADVRLEPDVETVLG